MINRIKILLLTFIISGLPNTALARWATYQDAGIEQEYIKQNIHIYKDNSSISIYEIQAKILKEESKSDWAQYKHEYNSITNTVKVIKANTINNNKTYDVKPHDIYHKDIASDSGSFDSQKQIIIPYPNVEINSTVYLKLKTIRNKNSFSKYFARYFSFGEDYTKLSSIYITSEVPLYINIYDPEKVLTITQKTKKIKNKTWYLINIEQKQPLYKEIIDENLIIFNPKHRPIVCVASMENEIHDYNALAAHYQNIKKQKLPILYKNIADIASTKNTLTEKINTVTSLLSEKITYLSDCRTFKEGRIARPLEQVANSRLGDCKDFSMATSVILESIGIPSNIALVYRGELALPAPDILSSSPWDSNHAIVKVNLPTGPLWIDPTNFVSSTHLFPDIANRRAIVLEVNNSHYENIPPIKAITQGSLRRATWNIDKNSQAHITGSIEFYGIAARHFSGAAKKHSEHYIKNSVLQMLGNNQMPIVNYDIGLPDLHSTIVKDLLFKYNITAEFASLKTNSGKAMPLMFSVAKRLMTKKEAVSDLYLGSPQIIEDYLTLNNVKPIAKYSLNCHIESPWANISREVHYENNQAIIHHKLEIKKSWIEAEQFKSDIYQKLQRDLEQNFNSGAALVFN